MIRKLLDKILKKKVNNSQFKIKLKNFLSKHSRTDENSPVVLIWDMGGLSAVLARNGVFSAALNLRGYKTHAIICDGTPEACARREIHRSGGFNNWNYSCKVCLKDMQKSADKYSLNYSLAGEFIDDNQKDEFRNISESIDIKEIKDYKYLGLNIGEYAASSFIRYLQGYPFNIIALSEEQEIIYRKYFYAAMINTYIANQVLDKLKIESLLTSHAIYVDYAPPVFLSVLKGINNLYWASGFNKFHHYFLTPKSVHQLVLRGISQDEWQKRINKDLTDQENTNLNEYINNRFFSNKSSDVSFISPPDEVQVLKQKLGIKNNNPIICLFTHISWDACIDFQSQIFENSDLWAIESVKKMCAAKNVNWIIKVHPGELIHGNAYSLSEEIKKQIKEMPDHVKILGPDSDINTYGLYQLIDAGITIFGTVGAELPLFGKPIISASEAHFSGKGFSFDAKTKEEYFDILENAHNIKPLSKEQVNIARKYAYQYFIQRQIPLNIIDKDQGHWGDIELTKINKLLPGKDPVIDEICAGIIHGKQVILD